MIFRSLLIFLVVLILVKCHSVEQDDITGLWQLHAVEIDGYNRDVKPVFVELKPNNSFALSQVSGDRIGFYRLENGKIRLKSKAGHWFNTSWNLTYFNNSLKLEGLEEGYRVTTLTFKKIDKIPDFQEFEDKIIGEWQLYKIRKKQEVEKLTNTWMEIDTTGYYSIANEEGVLESGHAVINPRHRKIFFENEAIQWTAWFYGDELRLDNEKVGVQYSLRKSK